MVNIRYVYNKVQNTCYMLNIPAGHSIVELGENAIMHPMQTGTNEVAVPLALTV